MELDLHKLTRLLEALSDTARLRLLALCQHGELSVKELTEATTMSQPRVSRHLRILVEADILDRFRENHWVYYRMRFDGDAVSLARAALARVPNTDQALQADANRLDVVLASRARALRALSDDATASGRSLITPADWSRVERATRHFAAKALGPRGLGELLDVGTGTGRMLRTLGADARHAEGIDTSDVARQATRAMLREQGLAHCSVREGDMYNLPFGNRTFDTVVFSHVLTSSEEPWRAIGEAARALRNAGHLLIMELLPDGMPVEAWCQALTGWLARAGVTVVAHELVALHEVTAVLYLGRRQVPANGKISSINQYRLPEPQATAK